MSKEYLGWVDKINVRSQTLRARYFEPILKFLTKYKITANQITNFRLVLGILSLLLCYKFYRFGWAVNVLLVANILDIIDGSLARYQNTASDRGKFLDVFVDYVIYAFLLALASVMAGSIREVAYNLFIIPVLYLLATIKKQEFLPSDWLIKVYPRITYVKAPVYLAFFAHWYFDLHLKWLDRSIELSNILATILSLYYFLYIQLRWKKIK